MQLLRVQPMLAERWEESLSWLGDLGRGVDEWRFLGKGWGIGNRRSLFSELGVLGCGDEQMVVREGAAWQ